MANYLNPKYDLTFKRVFGEHKHLCISLLNSMLPLEETQQVVSIEYQTGELIPEIPALRNSIVDVRCTDNFNRQFIVEMQMNWVEDFKSRVLFNASKAYVQQLNKGEEIKLLQPVYALNFINDNFELSPEMKDEYYHHYKIVNIKDTEKQIKGLEFIFIELPKFRPHNRGERKLHNLWLRFLTEINEQTEQAPAELLANEYTQEAIKYMEIGAYTRQQLDAYAQFKIDLLTVRNMFSTIQRQGWTEGWTEGREKGWEKGQSEGWEKGQAEGWEKGQAEGRAEEKIIIATKLKKLGLSAKEISESTGLSAKEVEKLRNE